jgi:parallel beta-helix repeat protein
MWYSTNATYTIQKAFDNLPTQGGKVLLKAGVYPVNGIYITNKKTLDDSPYQQIIFEGEGKEVATLKLNDNSQGVSSKLTIFPSYVGKSVIWCEPFNLSSGIRVTISNIGIDGNRKNQNSEVAGIALYNDWDCSVENNYLYNCGGHGIMILGSRWARTTYVSDNYVYYTDMAGQKPANPPNPVECYLSGILSWKSDVVLRDNTIGWTGFRNESSYLGVGISANFAIIQGNWLWGNYVGIIIANGQFFNIEDNFIENNVNGIYLWNSHGGSIQSNEIRLSCNPDTGIKISGNSSDNSIKINKIWSRDNSVAQYGIREMDTADYNKICDNDITIKSQAFVSDGTVNSVGTILNPIAITGSHSVLSGNNVDQEAGAETLATRANVSESNFVPWSLLFLAFAGGVLPLLFRKK